MRSYLARRLLLAIPTILGVATLVFLIVRIIPGDPARVMAGDTASDEKVEQIRHDLGLDLPFAVQYFQFLTRLAALDLGRSIATGRPVSDEILQRLPYTLVLAIAATIVGSLIGVVLGVIAATRHGSFVDVAASTLSVAGMSMPTYALGLILVIVFAINLRILPAAGATEPASLILPTMTLATLSIALIARMSRAAMLDVLAQDYMRTGRAKGLNRRTLTVRHALRNASLPIVTAIGLQFGALLGGAVLTETVFSWPGMGRLLVDSIFARDYPVIQGCVLVFAVGFITVNIVVDVLYVRLDPRITYH